MAADVLSRLKDWAGVSPSQPKPVPTMNELLRQAGEQPRSIVLPGKGVASTSPRELLGDIRLRPEMEAPAKPLGNIYALAASTKLDWSKVTLDGPARQHQDPERTRNERQATINQMPRLEQAQAVASRASRGQAMER